MFRRMLLANRWIAFAVVLCASQGLAMAVEVPHVCPTCPDECLCIPNTRHFGHYPTLWRRWPGESRLDTDFPESIGAEVIPPPPGVEPTATPTHATPAPGEPPAARAPSHGGLTPPGGAMPGEPPMMPPNGNGGEIPAEPEMTPPSANDMFDPYGLDLPPSTNPSDAIPGGLLPEVPGAGDATLPGAGFPSDDVPPPGTGLLPGGVPSSDPGPPPSGFAPRATEVPPSDPPSPGTGVPPGGVFTPSTGLPSGGATPPGTTVPAVAPPSRPAGRMPSVVEPPLELPSGGASMSRLPADLAENAAASPEPASQAATPSPSVPQVTPPATVPTPPTAAPPIEPAAPQAPQVARLPATTVESPPPEPETLRANWMSALHPGFRGDPGRLSHTYPTTETSRHRFISSPNDEQPAELPTVVNGPATPAAEAKEPPAVQPATGDSAALEGYCPVELCRHERWVEGDARYAVAFDGKSYLLSGEQQQQEFLAQPERFCLAYAGCDPVLLVDGSRQVPGQTDFCVTYDGRLYAFSSAITLKRFQKNPDRYAEELQ